MDQVQWVFSHVVASERVSSHMHQRPGYTHLRPHSSPNTEPSHNWDQTKVPVRADRANRSRYVSGTIQQYQTITRAGHHSTTGTITRQCKDTVLYQLHRVAPLSHWLQQSNLATEQPRPTCLLSLCALAAATMVCHKPEFLTRPLAEQTKKSPQISHSFHAFMQRCDHRSDSTITVVFF